MSVFPEPQFDRNEFEGLPLAAAIKYSSHILFRNNMEFVRPLLSQSKTEYSPEDNRSKYEEGWASDDSGKENLGSRIGVVGRKISVIPLSTYYSHVRSLVSRQLDSNPEKPATVLEIGAGNG